MNNSVYKVCLGEKFYYLITAFIARYGCADSGYYLQTGNGEIDFVIAVIKVINKEDQEMLGHTEQLP